MAKQGKLLPARRRRGSRTDESVLLRSAESLGRMIGTLQRQLDDARQRFGDSLDDSPDRAHNHNPRRSTRRTKQAKTAATRKKTTAAKRTTKSAGSRKAAKRPSRSR